MPTGPGHAYGPSVFLLLLAAAVVWGAGAGLLIPRIAYRLCVEPEEPWRSACPDGHPITGPLGGWLGRARCAVGETGGSGVTGERVAGGTGVPERAAPDTSGTTDARGAAGDTGAPARCRYGPRTTTVVLVTVFVCAALAAATGVRPEAVVWLLAAPVGVLLAVVDHRVHRLPDPLTLPLAAGLVVLLGIAALLPGHAGSWPTALFGLVVLGAICFVLFLAGGLVAGGEGFGFGDVKLALALGAALGWYGWTALFFGFFAGLVPVGCYGIVLLLLRRKGFVALGPYLLGGAFLGVLFGAL